MVDDDYDNSMGCFAAALWLILYYFVVLAIIGFVVYWFGFR